MPYNGHVKKDSLPWQFRIPDATESSAGVMSAADKTKLDNLPAGGEAATICSLGANETNYTDGNTYGVGVAGFATDPGSAAPFLVSAEVTPSVISFFSATAPGVGQTLTARIVYSPDRGATQNFLGDPLSLTEGEKYVSQTLPGTVTLPAGSYLKVAVDIDSGNLTTALSTSVG